MSIYLLFHMYVLHIPTWQDDTVDSAVATLTGRGVTQPMLLRVRSNYYIKVDSSAIPITDCSSFVEAVEFLFMTFYVLSVQYPAELRIFYGFIEHILGVKNSVGKSSTLSNFMRLLSSRHQTDRTPQDLWTEGQDFCRVLVPLIF